MYSTVYSKLSSVVYSAVLLCCVFNHSLNYNYSASDAKLSKYSQKYPKTKILNTSPILTSPFYTVIFTRTLNGWCSGFPRALVEHF